MGKRVIFYSIGCPKCKVLKIKLDKAQINYDVVDDINEMQKLGITSLPMLNVDEQLLDFTESINWLNTVEGGINNAN